MFGDIVCHIVDCLSYQEGERLKLVCKDWHVVIHDYNPRRSKKSVQVISNAFKNYQRFYEFQDKFYNTNSDESENVTIYKNEKIYKKYIINSVIKQLSYFPSPIRKEMIEYSHSIITTFEFMPLLSKQLRTILSPNTKYPILLFKHILFMMPSSSLEYLPPVLEQGFFYNHEPIFE